MKNKQCHQGGTRHQWLMGECMNCGVVKRKFDSEKTDRNRVRVREGQRQKRAEAGL